MYLSLYICIYVYRERERERDLHTHLILYATGANPAGSSRAPVLPSQPLPPWVPESTRGTIILCVYIYIYIFVVSFDHYMFRLY